MDTSNKIIEVDPAFIDHEPLILGMGICGTGTSYHDPALGTTVILPHDKPFTEEWHEGAHSFITQTTFLGLFMILFSNSIFELAMQLNKTEKSENKFAEEERKKVLWVILKLCGIRKSLLENFGVLHEMFALLTERTTLIANYLQKHSNKIKDLLNDLKELDNNIFSKKNLKRNKLYIKSLYLIGQFCTKYGNLDYVRLMAQWLLTFQPLVITKIEPDELLYGKSDELWFIPQNSPSIISSLLNDVLYGMPDSSCEHEGDLLEEIQKRCESLANIKFSTIYPYRVVEWIKKFIDSLPLDNDGKRSLELRMNHSILLEIHPPTEEPLEYMKFQKEIRSNPLTLPPHMALIRENDTLKLAVRQDLYETEKSLQHIALRNTIMPIIEMVHADEYRPIILCFLNHVEGLSDQCTYNEGPEKCLSANGICNWAKIFGSIHGIKFSTQGPKLICCKGNSATFFYLSDSGEDLIPFQTYPFEIIKKELRTLIKISTSYKL